MIKKTIFALYALVVVCIGLATIIEKYKGTPYVGENIYGAWWFVVLWAVLTGFSLIYIIRRKVYQRMAVMMLHMSFVVILVGALLTYLTAERGEVNLRIGKSVDTFVGKGDSVPHRLPAALKLSEFRIINYPGTDAPLDYQSIVTVHGQRGAQVTVSMNNVGSVEGYRLFQSSYDSDGKGVTLGVYHDPWGITVTYTGYLMLLLSMIFTMLSKKTQIRTLYRKAVRPLVMVLLLSCGTVVMAEPLPVVDRDIAHRMGTVNVQYGDRICPLNTVAIDFVRKLTGSSSWNGYSADEIFLSWMIYYSPWERQPIIRIKSRYVQELLGIEGKWASYSDFIDVYNEYKLKSAVEKMRRGEDCPDRKGLTDADEKYNVVAMFYQGQMLRLFPYNLKEGVKWYSPGSQVLPREIPVKEQFFIKQSMDFLTESIVTGQKPRAMEIIAKIKLFQRDMIGDMLPSTQMTGAEIFYNKINAVKWPVMLSLTFSLLICIAVMMKWRRSGSRWFDVMVTAFAAALLAYLTLLLGLRWVIGGHVPVSNGYETMQFMAWAILIITLLMRRKFPMLTAFGLLIASFCMLVAMIASGTPQITQLMPVLQSPLLSVHVMTVMCAYALFALQVLLGVQALWLIHKKEMKECEQATALSQLLLYPAVFLLCIGIFLGAVWANVSWGTYWSWDPKETWALITMMVYAVPMHKGMIGRFGNPRFYHIYIICAFLSVLVTYFGVNYLLGGMHSYA